MRTRPRRACAWALVAAWAGAVLLAQQPDERPRYVNGADLTYPADYRSWVFLSTGLGMEYEEEAGNRAPLFGNVFVNPSSHRAFLETGAWPDQTTFVLEFRASTGEGSINRAGRFQGDIVAVEANVKDARLEGGWGFYNFGRTPAASAPPLPDDAGCLACHTEHGAVEKTFVQFYPTLLEVAREKGTLRPGF
jgi:hypothetical protein